MKQTEISDRGLVRLLPATYHKPPALRGLVDTDDEMDNCMDMMRDHAATKFVHHTGSAWRPRTGSMVNRKHMTAALIDSRDFLTANRRAEAKVMLPAGSKVACPHRRN